MRWAVDMGKVLLDGLMDDLNIAGNCEPRGKAVESLLVVMVEDL